MLLAAAVSIFRNPFAFRETPPPMRKHRVVKAQPVVPARTPPVEPPQSPPVSLPQKPVTEWKYIGSFGPESDRFAAFAKDGDVLVVHAGDKVEEHVVRAVKPDLVEFNGGNGDIRSVALGR